MARNWFRLREGSSKDLPALTRVDGSFSNEWLLYLQRRGGPIEQTLELRWRKAAKLFGTYVVPVAAEETRSLLGVSGDAHRRAPLVYSDGCIHPITSMESVWTIASLFDLRFRSPA